MTAATRRRRWNVAWLALIVALAVILAWLASVPILRGAPDGREGVHVGEPAPPLALEDLDGGRRSVDDAEGRLVWVNFWAVSCEPCRTEMPAMEQLAARYDDRVMVLGVNWGESRDVVSEFVDRYGITYPILLDPTLETFYRWAGSDGLPRHTFIGPEGTVLREIVGPLDPARMAAIIEELAPPSAGG